MRQYVFFLGNINLKMPLDKRLVTCFNRLFCNPTCGGSLKANCSTQNSRTFSTLKFLRAVIGFHSPYRSGLEKKSNTASLVFEARKENNMNSLSVNEAAPDFILPCDTGDTMSLNDLKGKNVVLYFYPKDDTPGCTQESKDFRDRNAEFLKHDTVVLGVSRDNVDKHENFKKKYDLPFNLISDEDGVSLNEYGVWVEKSMYGKKYMGIERATYLIDKTGHIVKIWRKVSVDGHAEEVLAAVRELK